VKRAPVFSRFAGEDANGRDNRDNVSVAGWIMGTLLS
jgi:hypothetical protein